MDYLLVTVDRIGLNSDWEGNSYDENDEKAYQLRNIALLYFQLGNKAKAVEILNKAIVESKNIQGACALYNNRDKALKDFALDFLSFGEYERCIEVVKMITGEYMFDNALSEIIDTFLTKNDITTAKKTVELMKDKDLKEEILINLYIQDVSLKNINNYIQSIKSINNISIKCSGLAKLAVKYYHIKGDGNKITSDLLNESLEIAKQIKNNYRKDELLAEVAGRYAEVKQFEKGKSLASKIDWPFSKATGLMNIAVQYRKINQLGQAENLLDQAWDITVKSQEGLDLIETLQAIVRAYGECGLLDKSLLRAKSIGYDPQFHNDALLTVALYYSQNKQPESALNVLRDFQTNVRDQMKAWAIGEIIDQLSTTDKEESMRILAIATEILDSIPDQDWKYLSGLKNEDYMKIAFKYIELKQYDQAIQIIGQKLNNYDVKVGASVKAILLYGNLNKVIDKNRDDFINKVSSLTL